MPQKKNRDNIGNREQEVLVKAMGMFLLKNIKASPKIIVGMFRLCISDTLVNYAESFKDVSKIKDTKIDSFILDVLNTYFERMKLDLRLRRKLKYDCLQIYERWKDLYKSAPPLEDSADPVKDAQKDRVIGEKLSENLQELDLGEAENGTRQEKVQAGEKYTKEINKIMEDSDDFDLFR